MDRGRKNHCRNGFATALFFAGVLTAGLVAFARDAAAERGDRIYEDAWSCSSLYSRWPTKVANGNDLQAAKCLGEGGRPAMTRSEAWQLCRDQFDTTTQFVSWTSKGWHCRFYPR